MHRRDVLRLSAAAAGAMAIPAVARAAQHSQDAVSVGGLGQVNVFPISHASVVLQTPAGVIYVDPVGSPAAYAELPPADLILITHEHGDHYNAEVLAAVGAGNVPMVVNPAVNGKMGETGASTVLENGQAASVAGFQIEAIPAYNITAERLNFHPEGRDNGYVINANGGRIYVSGDTEDIPAMRALQGIDLAFVCMNLPFTMDAAAAASAVIDFKPSVVYPYHYRGRDGGTQDPQEFANLVGDASQVRFADWY